MTGRLRGLGAGAGPGPCARAAVTPAAVANSSRLLIRISSAYNAAGWVACDNLGSMLFESDKVMFEIYRETEYSGQYRVVYFTELQDHNKETEINHALAGEHFYDGFIKNFRKDQAKEIISGILERLNRGEHLPPQEVERALGEHLA